MVKLRLTPPPPSSGLSAGAAPQIPKEACPPGTAPVSTSLHPGWDELTQQLE